MPIINICVRNKIASSDCKQYIVCKNDGYVAVFDFDKEWESYELKTAKFAYDEEHYIPVVFRGNQCDIPRLPNTSLCSIEVEAGDIKTAVNAWVHCLPVLDDDYEEIAPPEPNVYDQIMQLINEEFFKGEQNAEEIARILAEITTIYERIVANAESIEANEREFLEALGKKLDNALNIQKDRFVSYDPEKKTMVDTGISVSEIGEIKQSVSQNATNIDTVGDNLADLTERFNALANSDDRTLDELKEIVAYIKANKALIESITISKVNVSDIIDNLNTNNSQKPLSAKQGVELLKKINKVESDYKESDEKQHQEIALKVSKIANNTSNARVYAESGNNGGATAIDVSNSPLANSIPMRNKNGTFEVAHPEVDPQKEGYSENNPITLKTADERYQKQGEVGVSSWNDLKDKPVIKEGSPLLNWDGSTEGKVFWDMVGYGWDFYKISDKVPSREELSSGGSFVWSNEYGVLREQTFNSTVVYNKYTKSSLISEYILCVHKDDEDSFGTEHGIYFRKIDSSFVSSLTIKDYSFADEKIDPNILTGVLKLGKQELTDEQKAQVRENIGVTEQGGSGENCNCQSDYSDMGWYAKKIYGKIHDYAMHSEEGSYYYTTLGLSREPLPQTEGVKAKVKYGNDEYNNLVTKKIVDQSNGEVSYCIGNRSIYDSNYEDTGEPFLIVFTTIESRYAYLIFSSDRVEIIVEFENEFDKMPNEYLDLEWYAPNPKEPREIASVVTNDKGYAFVEIDHIINIGDVYSIYIDGVPHGKIVADLVQNPELAEQDTRMVGFAGAIDFITISALFASFTWFQIDNTNFSGKHVAIYLEEDVEYVTAPPIDENGNPMVGIPFNATLNVGDEVNITFKDINGVLFEVVKPTIDKNENPTPDITGLGFFLGDVNGFVALEQQKDSSWLFIVGGKEFIDMEITLIYPKTIKKLPEKYLPMKEIAENVGEKMAEIFETKEDAQAVKTDVFNLNSYLGDMVWYANDTLQARALSITYEYMSEYNLYYGTINNLYELLQFGFDLYATDNAIVYNGNQYLGTLRNYDAYYYIGNLSLYLPEAENTNEPFLILLTGEQDAVIFAKDEATIIVEFTTQPFKLPNEYLNIDSELDENSENLVPNKVIANFAKEVSKKIEEIGQGGGTGGGGDVDLSIIEPLIERYNDTAWYANKFSSGVSFTISSYMYGNDETGYFYEDYTVIPLPLKEGVECKIIYGDRECLAKTMRDVDETATIYYVGNLGFVGGAEFNTGESFLVAWYELVDGEVSGRGILCWSLYNTPITLYFGSDANKLPNEYLDLEWYAPNVKEPKEVVSVFREGNENFEIAIPNYKVNPEDIYSVYVNGEFVALVNCNTIMRSTENAQMTYFGFYLEELGLTFGSFQFTGETSGELTALEISENRFPNSQITIYLEEGYTQYSATSLEGQAEITNLPPHINFNVGDTVHFCVNLDTNDLNSIPITLTVAMMDSYDPAQLSGLGIPIEMLGGLFQLRYGGWILITQRANCRISLLLPPSTDEIKKLPNKYLDTEYIATKDELNSAIGDISSALDELHNYAQNLISGDSE